MPDQYTPDMQGAIERQQRLDLGQPPDQVADWEQQQRAGMLSLGAKPADVDRYWGQTTPDTKALNNYVTGNLANLSPEGQAKVAENSYQMLAAGWQHGDIGLALNKPDLQGNPNSGIMGNISYAVGQAAGDLPAMVGGFFAGGGVGGPVGAAVGTMAAPEAIRRILMDQYDHPEGVRNVKDLWDRSVDIAWGTAKAGIVGGVMGPAGTLGGSLGEKVIGGALARGVGSAAGMTAAVAGVGAGLEGHMPSYQDVATAGAMIVGFHVAGTVVGATGRFQLNSAGEAARQGVAQTYAETGQSPDTIAKAVATDPGLFGQVLGTAPSGEKVITDLPKAPEVKPFDQTKAAKAAEVSKENPPTPAAPGNEEQQADQRPLAEAALKSTLGEEYNEDIVKYDIATLPDDLVKRVDDVIVAQQDGVSAARAWVQGDRDIRSLPIHTQRLLEWAEIQGHLEGTSYAGKLDTSLAKGDGVDPATLPEHGVPEEPVKSLAEGEQPTLKDDLATVRSTIMPPSDKPGWFAPFMDWRNLFSMPSAQFTPARTLDLEHGVQAGQAGVERILRMGLLGVRSRIQSILRYGPIEPVAGSDWDYRPAIREDGSIIEGSPQAAYEAIAKAGGNKTDFFSYLTSGLTVEQAERGFDTGIDFNAALRIWNDPDMIAKYAGAAKLWREFTDGVPNLMSAEGRMSTKLAQAWKDLNRTYVTIQRVQDPTFNARDATRAFGYKGIAKARTGGDSKFIDPEVSSIANAAWQIGESSRNKATLMLIDEMRKRDPNSMVLKDTLLPNEIEDIKPVMDNAGNMQMVPPDLAPAIAQARILQRASGRAGPDDFVAYQPDGSVQIWTAQDKNLAQIAAYHSLGDPGWGWSILHKSADIARLGITANLGFTTRAVWHQQIAQAVSFGHGMVPFQSLMEGIGHVIGQDDVYQNWLRNGGGGTFMGLDRLADTSHVHTLFRDGATIDNVMNVMKHPIDSLLALDHLAQEAGRVGTAKHLVDNEGKTWSQAAEMSRTAALDFAEKSTSNFVNNWQRSVPFMNVGFKDLEQVGRAIQDDPAGFLTRGFLYVGVPTLALSALNGFVDQYLPDDQKYSEIPDAYRMMFWITPPINGHRLWMPKPYVMSMLFADPVEAFTQWAFKERQMQPHEVLSLFGHQALPSSMPTLFSPVAEELANKSLYTGRPLIPDSLAKASGYMQYTPNTTETAKRVAELIGPTRMDIGNVSPITIQNYVQEWGGSMPMQILRAMEMPFRPPSRPADVTDIPMVGSFFRRTPGMGADSIQHFYDEMDSATATREDLKLAMKTGDLSKITDAEDMQFAGSMTGFTKALSNITTVIKAINDSDMPSSDKISLSDRLSGQAILMARQGTEMLDLLKKAHDTQTR